MSRRGVIGLIVGIGVVVILGIALIVAENVVRGVVTDRIDTATRAAFELDEEHPVAVDIGAGLVLPQILGGRLTAVSIDVPNVEAGSLRADVEILAEGVPLDETEPSDSIAATLSIAEGDVAGIGGFIAGTVIRDVELTEGEIVLTTGFDLLGISLELAVGIEPEVADGVVSFTPSSLALNGERAELEDLRGQFGGFLDPVLDPLLEPREFCIAEALPLALTVQRVDVRDAELVVVVSGKNIALGGDEFRTRGTCP